MSSFEINFIESRDYQYGRPGIYIRANDPAFLGGVTTVSVDSGKLSFTKDYYDQCSEEPSQFLANLLTVLTTLADLRIQQEILSKTRSRYFTTELLDAADRALMDIPDQILKNAELQKNLPRILPLMVETGIRPVIIQHNASGAAVSTLRL